MQTIITPVDFTDLSAYGSKLAADVAKHTHAQLHFLHIIPLPSHVLLTPEGDLFEDGDFDTSVPRKQKQEAEIKMQAWKEVYYPQAITSICFGKINEELLKYASTQEASLIVMGTHQTIGVKELLQNSHAEYVAMHSNAPVLSLKCDCSHMQVKSIVLAASFKTDDVPHCETVLKLAAAFNAKLHLLRVNIPSDKLEDKIILTNMSAFATKHQLVNVEFAIINHQDVEDGIMQYVADLDIDILAIGSKQRTGLNKIINGCVSADLVNHAMKPILTFKLKN
jgi:nucleotide-binding universal stress UspA family protein